MHSANRAKQRLRTSAAAAAELTPTENKKTENKNKSKQFLTPNLNSSASSRRCKSLERKNVSSRNKNYVKREFESPKPIRTTGKTLNSFLSGPFFIY